MFDMRPVTSDEFVKWTRAEARADGNRLDDDPEILRPHFDLERSIGVFEGTDIVGGAHSHVIEMSIPGGSATIAGVANIAVQPTHTRQGIMTRMMHHQIHDIHERGEPLAALFATESIIYGRFGYGIGSLYERWTIDRSHNRYSHRFENQGRVSFIDPAGFSLIEPRAASISSEDHPFSSKDWAITSSMVLFAILMALVTKIFSFATSITFPKDRDNCKKEILIITMASKISAMA